MHDDGGFGMTSIGFHRTSLKLIPQPSHTSFYSRSGHLHKRWRKRPQVPFTSMDEIIPGLWIGDLQSAKNVENLKAHGIFSILTAMRGRITIHEVLLFPCWRTHSILIPINRLSSATKSSWTIPRMRTSWLTFCHPYTSSRQSSTRVEESWSIAKRASVRRSWDKYCEVFLFPNFTGRSSTVVAAYLMYLKDLDPRTALDLIRQARPSVEYVLDLGHFTFFFWLSIPKAKPELSSTARTVSCFKIQDIKAWKGHSDVLHGSGGWGSHEYVISMTYQMSHWLTRNSLYQMVMDLLPKLKCSQNIHEHLLIPSRTRLAVLGDG